MNRQEWLNYYKYTRITTKKVPKMIERIGKEEDETDEEAYVRITEEIEKLKENEVNENIRKQVTKVLNEYGVIINAR